MMKIRHYFSTQHFLGGVIFARRAAELEAEGADPPTQVLISTHRAHVVTSILSAVAFLEASINEVFANASDDVRELPNPEVRELFPRMWKRGIPRTASYSVIEKHQVALALAEAQVFEAGRAPCQDAQLVVRFRNALVHYEPEWIEPDGHQVSGPDEFEKLLHGKFPENTLLVPIMTAYFPDRVLGAGCGMWALEAVLSFAEEFLARLGIEGRISGARSFLETGDWSAERPDTSLTL